MLRHPVDCARPLAYLEYRWAPQQFIVYRTATGTTTRQVCEAVAEQCGLGRACGTLEALQRANLLPGLTCEEAARYREHDSAPFVGGSLEARPSPEMSNSSYASLQLHCSSGSTLSFIYPLLLCFYS
jgi:hypothetical protein